MKKLIFIFLLLCVSLFSYSQNKLMTRTNNQKELYMLLGIDYDVKELEKHISRAIKADKDLSNYEGIKQFYVFVMINNARESDIISPDLKDTDLLYRLRFTYVRWQLPPFKGNTVIRAITYLATKENGLIGYVSGNKLVKYTLSKPGNKELAKMILNDEITFACLIDGMDDFLILKQENLYRVVVGTDSIYVLPYDKKLIPLN